MTNTRKSWWILYAIAILTIATALGWITVLVLQLEHNEISARADAEYQESLRLALWRMDSWLAPRLARESARPYFEYQPFYEPQRIYSPDKLPLSHEGYLTVSPLLNYSNELFPLHFQLDEQGAASSPQIPQAKDADIAINEPLKKESILSKRLLLDEVAVLLTDEYAKNQVALGEQRFNQPQVDSEQFEDSQNQRDAFKPIDVQSRKGAREADARRQNANIAQQSISAPGIFDDQKEDSKASAIEVGPLVPVWAAGNSSGKTRLMFLRRCNIGNKEFYQGILTDWQLLETRLLEQIADLFPDAQLKPIPVTQTPARPTGQMLATVPATLITAKPSVATVSMLSPARLTLALTWLAMGLAAIGIGVALRASIAFADKRSRFASAVTHELRTPLTTFQMYSEMLADGMVQDSAKRQEYLETLKVESRRLSGLVENVLSYARLEEKRRPIQTSKITIADLLERILPQLQRRADDAQMQLSVVNNITDGMAISVDSDALGQIMFNLIDNACKYACDANDRSIDCNLQIDGSQLVISVRDHGRGVPSGLEEIIFVPFERGDRDPSDPVPGVGLGLALARGLARELGGDLVMQDLDGEDGAGFEVKIAIGDDM